MPCLSWCNAYTCEQTPCGSCGPSRGCSVAKYGHREEPTGGGASRNRCAKWCSQYTCSQPECLDCGRLQGCEGREPPSPPKPPPRPHLPPVSLQTTGYEFVASDYFTYGSSLLTNAWDGAEAIQIRGASWFGMETKACVVGGAEHLPIETIAGWLKEQGFNAIRLPLAADAVLTPDHPCLLEGDRASLRLHNTVLGSLDYVSQIGEVVHAAGDAGLLVLLDMHVLVAGHWPDGGVVGGVGKKQLFDAWDRLADTFCDPNEYWNVMGADLKNEPYGMWWGPESGNDPSADPSPMRWDTLATELGRRVHSRCQRWVTLVEGVGHCRDPHPTAGCTRPSAGSHQDMDMKAGTWWGENLQAAAAAPVRLLESSSHVQKVVYSPHTYGPSTHFQQQFDTSAFPSNMPHIWDTQFGHLARDGLAPVVIGEFGGLCDGKDAQLQRTLVDYMTSRGIGGFWWALNPESSDTGGLIKSWDDGSILPPERHKLTILSALPVSRVPRTSERRSSFAAAPQAPPAIMPPPPPIYRVILAPPPPPPPPPTPPPPPLIAEVQIMGGDSVPKDSVWSSYVWPSPPPSPPPDPPSPPPWPLPPPSHPLLSGALAAAMNGGTSFAGSADDTSASTEEDSVWLVDGLVLRGWGGVGQIALIALGLLLLWALLPTIMPAAAPTEELEEVELSESSRQQSHGARKKSSKKKRNKRWERVADDEADRVADEPTNEEVLEEVAVVQEPPSGLLSAVAGLDSMVEDLHRAAPGGAREVNWT